MTTSRRVGLLGGSFDPIHIGHLIMAENALEQLHLDEVVFVPAANPPHKTHKELATAEHRIEMIELAIAGSRGFSCSRIDTEQDEPAFTWKLLERYLDRFPSTELAFIMGGDSLNQFDTWARPDRILELATIAVVDRPGFRISKDVIDAMPGLRQKLSIVETPMCSISSTEIRDRVENGRTIRFLVPESVRAYILDKGLYSQMET